MTRLTAIVFSKDRPLQVDGTLRSMLGTCRDAENLDVRVLYRASDATLQELYRRAAAENPSARFVAEEGFRSTLLELAEPAEAILFAVDDCLFVRPWSAAEVMGLLEGAPEVLGFSLRLGRNTTSCYMLDAPQRLPRLAAVGTGILAFDWTRGEHDFGYPLELSSSAYRAADLLPLLREFSYRNPNDLESRLAEAASRFARRAPLLLCGERSIAFCAPLNVVQRTHPNRVGGRAEYSPEALARAYAEGKRVDVQALRGHVPRACHEEVDLPLAGSAPPPPRVSVIIPCWRQAEYLPQAVESVVAQTFSDWEAVIVDDGSPDDTAAVAEALARRWPSRPIRLLRQPNRGVARARNAGIAASRGPLVLPLDADDVLDPLFLERTVRALERSPEADIAFSDVVQFGAREAVCRMGPFELEALRERNVACCTALYRREAWELVGGYNPNMVLGYEDWDFWVGCAARGLRAVHVAEPLFGYRVVDARADSGPSRNQGAMRNHRRLRARVVLNHPEVFGPDEREEAEALLARVPLPPDHCAPPRPEGAPRVTVVMPCYRQASYLPEAVASVALQSFQDWELVIVDDGSPDDTAEVAQRLIARLPGKRIRLLRQANAGLAQARNAGIRAGAGRYVLPLDADDLLDPEYLARTVEALESRPDADICATDGISFGARQELLRPDVGRFEARALAVANRLNYCSLYRREVWEAVGGYNPNMVLGYEDWDFWVGAAEHGFRTVGLALPLFLYRVKDQSMYTRAVRHDAQLRARLALNHPRLYDAGTLARARAILAAEPLPPHGAGDGPPPSGPEPVPAPAPLRRPPGQRPSLPAAPVDPGQTLAALRAAGLWREGEALRLHLGCGENRLPGYVNVDLEQAGDSILRTAADALGDVTALRFPGETVDEVRLHHVFEHFPRVEALALLVRWREWLKPGGLLRIETPDLVGSARTLLSDAPLAVKMGVVRHLAGDQAEPWAFHVDHWFEERFRHTLEALGFEGIEAEHRSWPHPPFLSNVAVTARRGGDLPREELQRRAEALLAESALAPSEAPAIAKWRRQLALRLDDPAASGTGDAPRLPVRRAGTA